MSKPIAFITGIAGFVGSHLAEELLKNNYTVIGAIHPDEPVDNILHIRKDIFTYKLDILNLNKCKTVISKMNPDYIFHLAAIASVGESFKKEQQTYQVNFDGTLNILQASLPLKKLKKFVMVSSSEVYGIKSKVNRKLKESDECYPISPYAISKLSAENLSLYYFFQHKLPVVISRSFNHSGPRQSHKFAIPAFAKQIAAIEAGKQKPILKVGELSARRDFSDVRDIVCGYRKLAEQGKPGEKYILSTAKTTTINSVVNKLIKLSSKKIKVEQDKTRIRKNDIPYMRGDNSKAVKELGYMSRYSLKTTLEDTLNYWRDFYKVTLKRTIRR